MLSSASERWEDRGMSWLLKGLCLSLMFLFSPFLSLSLYLPISVSLPPFPISLCLCLSLSLSPTFWCVCVFWIELHNQRLDSLTVAENPVAVYPKKLEASEQEGNGTVAVQGWGVVVPRRLHGKRPHWKLKELEPLSLQHQVHSGDGTCSANWFPLPLFPIGPKHI